MLDDEMYDKVKQVIVIRRKFPDGKGGFFGMRMGKIVAQACHASNGAAFLQRSEKREILGLTSTETTLILDIPDNELEWYFEKFTSSSI